MHYPSPKHFLHIVLKLWNTSLYILDDIQLHHLDSLVKLRLKIATVFTDGVLALTQSKVDFFFVLFIPEMTSDFKLGWVQGHIDNRSESNGKTNQLQTSFSTFKPTTGQLTCHHGGMQTG